MKNGSVRGWIHNQYHWIIVLIVFLQLAAYGGIMNNYSGLFVIPVTEGLGISRGSFSLAISLKDLIGFAATMFAGTLLFRFGYRKIVMSGMFMGVLAFVTISFMDNVGIFALGNAMLGFCSGVCVTAGSAKIIGDWFYRHRGFILGLVSMATGLGGSLFCVILTRIIEISGWRNAFRFSAVLFFGIIILMFLFIKNHPTEIGLRPFGEGEEEKRKKKKEVSDVNWPGIQTKELFKYPTFYLLIFCTFLSCFCTYLTFSAIVPHMRGNGFSASQAAAFQSTMLLVMAASKLLWGGLSDRIGSQIVTVFCVLMTAVGQLLLAETTNLIPAWTGIAIYSLGLPITTVPIPLLTLSMIGYRSYDMAVGIILSMVSISAMIAQPCVNFVYDRIRTYAPVFYFAAILGLVTIALYLLMFQLAKKDRQSIEKRGIK